MTQGAYLEPIRKGVRPPWLKGSDPFSGGILSILLIVVLVGCPFVCLSEAPAARPKAAAARACCGCRCAVQGPAETCPAEPCPHDGQRDGHSKDCICGGAVVEAPVRGPASPPDLAECTGAFLPPESAADPAGCDSAAFSEPSHHPPPLTGRGRLVLFERLLL
jgi:hypothetical protein